MNGYEQRQEARRERLRRAAARAEQRARDSLEGARREVEGIPLGQPILVGHHSERRHRRALERHDAKMRRGLEEQERARRLGERAAAVGSAGVSSDDPDAIAKLEERAAELEAERGRRKAINAAWRKAGKPRPDDPDGWARVAEDTGIAAEALQRVRLGMARDPLDRGPFPSYALQNIGANIRRVRQRIEEIRKSADAPVMGPVRGDGYTVEEDRDENRICFRFEQRPPRDTCELMRRNGWRWNRRLGAWTRHLNAAGRASAECVRRQIGGETY